MRKPLREQLTAITQAVGDLTSADGLFAIPTFIAIYEQPEPVFGEAVSLLGDAGVGDDEKRVLGYLMQRLPLEPKLRWLTVAVELVETGRLPVTILESLAFPPYNWSVALAEHWQEPTVRGLIARIAALPGLDPNWRRHIVENLSTGRAWEQVQELRELGQVP